MEFLLSYQHFPFCYTNVAKSNGYYREYFPRSHQQFSFSVDSREEPWRQHYNDNLCFFRAVAAFLLNAQYDLATKTYELFQRFIEATQIAEASFDGTFLLEVPLREGLFGLQFLIYNKLNNKSQVVGKLVYRNEACASSEGSKTVSLLLVDNHACLLISVDSFCNAIDVRSVTKRSIVPTLSNETVELVIQQRKVVFREVDMS